MWNTIANFRENLSQIASDVLDTAEELEAGGSLHEAGGSLHAIVDRPDDPSQLRRQREAHLQAQIDWYKGEVRRLQATESNMSVKNFSLLKEKDAELSRLNEENQILKKKMGVIAAERIRWSNGDVEHAPDKSGDNNSVHDADHFGIGENHQYSYSETGGEQQGNGNSSLERVKELELQVRSLQESIKDLCSQIDEKDQAYAMLKDSYDQSFKEIRTLKDVLEKERSDFASANLQLQRERNVMEAAERESKRLKMENQKLSMEIAELKQRTDEKLALKDNTLNHLQEEFRKMAEEGLVVTDEKMEQLQKTIVRLEREKSELQVELTKLVQMQTQHLTSSKAEREADVSPEGESTKKAERLQGVEVANELQNSDFKEKLEAMRVERDKALRNLNRLKQHLLEKEQADSEKMDQDSERIVELQARADASSVRALQLEHALGQALANQAEVNKQSNESLQKANEEISLLKQRLSSCITTLESKNVELLNLQTALGQYYAESEAKERLHGELLAAKKEIASLSENLKAANRTIELKIKEKDEVLEKLAYEEHKVVESQQKMIKLEEEVVKLRRALEQSITRLNRMSSESDYYVDRRIVIKLLVTYFQRHHSREVLDLMVRMLGFSEEDKQAIGLAQQAAGKGVVRGVLGIPGRVVGGLLKSVPSESSSSPLPTENQSFADLWIDFLLKESEERERRTAVTQSNAEAGRWSLIASSSARVTQESSPKYNTTTAPRGSPLLLPQTSPKPSSNLYASNSYTPPGPPFRTSLATEPTDSLSRPLSLSELGDTAGSEFSTVPLYSASSPSPVSNFHYRRTNPLP